MSIDRYDDTARADGTSRPAAAATPVETQDAPGASPATDDPTPLEVMLATMRWAHEEAERQSAAAAALAGNEANDARKLIAGLRGLAHSVAKDAAPYVHARLPSAAPRDEGQWSHEDWVAWCEEEDRKAKDAAAREAEHKH